MNINDLCNIEILGNVKANQYAKDKGLKAINAKADDGYKAVACSTEDRQKEALKLKPYIKSGQINIATICKAAISAGGALSASQIKGWLEAEEVEQADGDSVTISRVEYLYYQMMLEGLDEAAKEKVKGLVRQKMLNERLEAYQREVDAKLASVELP